MNSDEFKQIDSGGIERIIVVDFQNGEQKGGAGRGPLRATDSRGPKGF